MNFEVGQKVRVKSVEEIYDTLDGFGCSKRAGVYWSDDMVKYCGQSFYIDSIEDEPVITLKKENGFNCWFWDTEWVEPVKDEKVQETFVAVYGLTEQEVKKLLKGTKAVVKEMYCIRTVVDVLDDIDEQTKTIDFIFHTHGRTTIGCSLDGTKIGIAFCNPEDDWDEDIAHALCKARAVGLDKLEQELISFL